MIPAGIAFLCLTGVFLIVKRAEVTSLHKVAIGARLHPGCAVAEGLLVIAIAAFMAILYFRGWFE